MSILCSILLPTRKNLWKLERCMDSILRTAQDKEDFEIVLQCRRDDRETMDALPRLLYKAPIVRCSIGLPMLGLHSVPKFVEEAAAIAHGQFFWLMGDDCEVLQGNWMEQLRKSTSTGPLLPEINKLGQNKYLRDPKAPFMVIRRETWPKVLPLTQPVDYTVYLRLEGEPVEFMQDVVLWHDNRNDDEKRARGIEEETDAQRDREAVKL